MITVFLFNISWREKNSLFFIPAPGQADLFKNKFFSYFVTYCNDIKKTEVTMADSCDCNIGIVFA